MDPPQLNSAWGEIGRYWALLGFQAVVVLRSTFAAFRWPGALALGNVVSIHCVKLNFSSLSKVLIIPWVSLISSSLPILVLQQFQQWRYSTCELSLSCECKPLRVCLGWPWLWALCARRFSGCQKGPHWAVGNIPSTRVRLSLKLSWQSKRGFDRTWRGISCQISHQLLQLSSIWKLQTQIHVLLFACPIGPIHINIPHIRVDLPP